MKIDYIFYIHHRILVLQVIDIFQNLQRGDVYKRQADGVRHVIDILSSADPDLQAGEVGDFPFGGEHVDVSLHEEGVPVCFLAMSLVFPHLLEQGLFELLVEARGHGQPFAVLLLFGGVRVVIFQRVGCLLYTSRCV